MPEGDTVYRTAVNLNQALAGRTLTRCDIRVPAFATVDLSGETVESVVSRGKHILMRVGEYTLHSHLKMEGSWHLYRHGAKWFRPEFQARAILGTDEVLAVGFDLGTFDVLRTAEEGQAVGYLGPDLLGADWDPDRALANLLSDPGREVGLSLLDQRNLAGLGNVYRAELCFLRGILPTRPVGAVSEPEKLIELAWRLIDANKDRASAPRRADSPDNDSGFTTGRASRASAATPRSSAASSATRSSSCETCGGAPAVSAEVGLEVENQLRGEGARDAGYMTLRASFSSSAMTESRCSGAPETTRTSQLPHTPLRHEPSTGRPLRSSASSTLSFAPTVSCNGLRVKLSRNS